MRVQIYCPAPNFNLVLQGGGAHEPPPPTAQKSHLLNTLPWSIPSNPPVIFGYILSYQEKIAKNVYKKLKKNTPTFAVGPFEDATTNHRDVGIIKKNR